MSEAIAKGLLVLLFAGALLGSGFRFGQERQKAYDIAYYQGKQREVLEVGTFPAKACGGEDCIVLPRSEWERLTQPQPGPRGVMPKKGQFFIWGDFGKGEYVTMPDAKALRHESTYFLANCVEQDSLTNCQLMEANEKALFDYTGINLKFHITPEGKWVLTAPATDDLGQQEKRLIEKRYEVKP